MASTTAAGVELTGNRAPSSDVEADAVIGGENADEEPLLLNDDRRTLQQQLQEQQPFPSTSSCVDAGANVHPLPNSSYTRDDRSWASKLFFSWANPVLEKVRWRLHEVPRLQRQ